MDVHFAGKSSPPHSMPFVGTDTDFKQCTIAVQ